MRCPNCGTLHNKVIDSRLTPEETSIRRRRICQSCGFRFTTYEYMDRIPLIVIKKNGRREPYNRVKLLEGLIKACKKRPISVQTLESIVDDVERQLLKASKKYIASAKIGEMVMKKLSKLDGVAYMRFVSIHREFDNVNKYKKELEELLDR